MCGEHRDNGQDEDKGEFEVGEAVWNEAGLILKTILLQEMVLQDCQEDEMIGWLWPVGFVGASDLECCGQPHRLRGVIADKL